MEGFTLGLALVDTIPIPSFGISMVIIAWIGLMGFTGWFRKHKFRNDDAHSNWTAQIINAIGQTCPLLGILFAG